MLRGEVIRHSQVNSSLFNMKVISKQPLWHSVIPETGHTHRHRCIHSHIKARSHTGRKTKKHRQCTYWRKREQADQHHFMIKVPSSSLVLCLSYFSWFSFLFSLRRQVGVLLMAVVINSYLHSVHIFPSVPLSTLLSICLSPYHFPFSTISLSLPSPSPSLSLHITSLCPSNPALPPLTLFHC